MNLITLDEVRDDLFAQTEEGNKLGMAAEAANGNGAIGKQGGSPIGCLSGMGTALVR